MLDHIITSYPDVDDERPLTAMNTSHENEIPKSYNYNDSKYYFKNLFFSTNINSNIFLQCFYFEDISKTGRQRSGHVAIRKEYRDLV